MSRSELQAKVKRLLRQAFPLFRIEEEYYVRTERGSLYFDFLLEDFILVEVDGRQHEEWVDWFHESWYDFFAQQRRDARKEEWAAANGYVLLRISWREVDKLTPGDLVRRLHEAMRRGESLGRESDSNGNGGTEEED